METKTKTPNGIQNQTQSFSQTEIEKAVEFKIRVEELNRGWWFYQGPLTVYVGTLEKRALISESGIRLPEAQSAVDKMFDSDELVVGWMRGKIYARKIYGFTGYEITAPTAKYGEDYVVEMLSKMGASKLSIKRVRQLFEEARRLGADEADVAIYTGVIYITFKGGNAPELCRKIEGDPRFNRIICDVIDGKYAGVEFDYRRIRRDY